MVSQIQIIADPNASQKEKGDFFEDLLRAVLEAQRYSVKQRINFTGTEIDLLCQHLDRAHETALVECKARASVVSEDIKNFAFDVQITKRAEYGFFVHTSELQHQAAGLVEELKEFKNLVFWGPEKVVELLLHCKAIAGLPSIPESPDFTPTKRILLYTYLGRFWVTLLSNRILPTHYHVCRASSSADPIASDALKLIAELHEVSGLSRFESGSAFIPLRKAVQFDAVAEIQEADQWDDYRPVGSRFFVGRADIRHRLYQFAQAPRNSLGSRRVFFIESKSGWGKSSLIAELRARSRNRRNKNWLYVLAVDSRSANTGAFVSIALAKLASLAARDQYIPNQFSNINIASSFDTLASAEMRSLLAWLRARRRVLVLVFDQFEDMFRKTDLFQAFHKFMMDVHGEQGNLIVGFSWKSEINIPIDNPAYSLWQQTRDLAEPFRLDEFLGFEVDRVLRQLEGVSGNQLPADLRRRLKESSQGFPWLTKRLSIHCYHQMQKGITPEALMDQNLNVDVLMKEDMETLNPEESRGLHLIAQRGYDGDPFDVAETDDKVGTAEIHSLLNKRLIVRSGSKYNIYWDIFRDFLIEGKVPTIGESFLLRQFPKPCVATLNLLLHHPSASLDDILLISKDLTEGTALNRLRELRYIGAITKLHDTYLVRPRLNSVEDFQAFIKERLEEHIVVRSLKRSVGESISHEDVVRALKANFKGYGFGNKTWKTYASYFIAWLRYAGIDFGRALGEAYERGMGPAAFVPQWRPEKDCDVLFSFRNQSGRIPRSKKLEKPLYDLKALGLLVYDGSFASLTKRGTAALSLNDEDARKEIARLALALPKIRQAHEALKNSRVSQGNTYEENLASVLSVIRSESYRKVAGNVLKSWARFICDELESTTRATTPTLF